MSENIVTGDKAAVESGQSKHVEPDIAKAVRAGAALEISSVRLTNFNSVTPYTALDTLPSKVDVKVAFTRPTTKVAGLRVLISSTFLFRVGLESGPPVADLRATAELLYLKKSDTEISEADIEQFALLNVPFNAWAYWREFVQSSLGRMNLPVISIPLFRIGDAPKLMIRDEVSFTDVVGPEKT